MKVHIFWEVHKILQNLHLRFILCSTGQIYGEDFAKFCGILRIYELYMTDSIKKIVIRTFSLRVHYFFPSFSLDISIHFWCCNLFFNTFFIPLSLEFKYLTLEKCFFTAHTENYSNRILFSVYPCCKFFVMSTEFDKNISDWRHDYTDYKNGKDFFMSLVKWPKIAVKKSQIF